MNRTAELDARIARWDINQHPFYVAWRMGTLPRAKLTDYAGEYDPFIASLPRAWETLGEPTYADEERAHAAMWQDFRAALGCAERSNHPESRALVATANELFASRAEAIGALYAFEAQQPRTARSKLIGLDAHYTMDDTAKKYFAVHADDTREAEMLGGMVEGLSEQEFARTSDACEVLACAMWHALDGVYGSGECA